MRRIVLAVLAIAVACGAIAFFSYQPHKTSSAQVPVQSAAAAQALPQIDYSTVALTKPYSDDRYKFSLSMPDNFAARQLPADDSGATTILLESADHADGVQITVTPWDGPATALTPEGITHDTGLTVTDPQPINIQGATGIMFRSDNPAFDGAASDAWFVSRGNIYQLSTYARDDAVLKKMLASWTFF